MAPSSSSATIPPASRPRGGEQRRAAATLLLLCLLLPSSSSSSSGGGAVTALLSPLIVPPPSRCGLVHRDRRRGRCSAPIGTRTARTIVVVTRDDDRRRSWTTATMGRRGGGGGVIRVGRRGDDRALPARVDDDDDDEGVGGPTRPSLPTVLRRFVDPVIDDPGLPLIDALVAQVVGPTLQVYWLAINSGPSPTWLVPTLAGAHPPRGSLLAPTLIHGAGLAVCWGLGALAARMYEREAYTIVVGGDEGTTTTADDDDVGPKAAAAMAGYAPILVGLAKAGAFAVGALVLATQFDLLLEYRGRYVMLGESDETDFRLLVAYVEVIDDVFWEALAISSWRIVHAKFMSDPENRRRRF